MFAMIFLIGFGSAVNTLAPVKQNECINIIQTCATCTYNNISVIRYPNNGTYALNQDMVMTKSGISYNYTFCNTSQFGTYFVDGYGDLAGVKTGWGGFTFDVNGSGQTITQSQITLIIIGIVVLLILSAFFFILSFIFKHPGTKIFLMAMSTLILIVLIGLMASQFSIYLAEFAGLASFYDKFYILIVSFSSVAMVGLIVWLIWYSLKTFNKVRGRVPED
jgi:hypothetical protein